MNQLGFLKKGVDAAGDFTSKNSPTILTAFSVGGLFATVGLALHGKTKADEVLWDEEEIRLTEWSNGTGEDKGAYPVDPIIPLKEQVQLTWKYYVPAVVMGAVTIGCMIGANTISVRRNAALTAVYTLTEKAMKEYQKKVVDTIGEKKEAKVRDDIAQDHLTEKPVEEDKIFTTGHGQALCFDDLSGRYFYSDMETIRKAQNDFNECLISEMNTPLNDLYNVLGLPNIKLGEDLGWTLENGKLDIHFSSKLTTDGRPCMVLTYKVAPRKLF